jgi:hypothetical protein
MKTISRILIFFLFTLITIACEKEDFSSDREIIESELKSIVNEEGITKCDIIEFYNNAWHTTITNSSFSFSNGFIIVYNSDPNFTIQYRYNLSFLYSYNFAGDKIFLYFTRQ